MALTRKSICNGENWESYHLAAKVLKNIANDLNSGFPDLSNWVGIKMHLLLVIIIL